jgi:uncharacterized protein (DUF2141 family)
VSDGARAIPNVRVVALGTGVADDGTRGVTAAGETAVTDKDGAYTLEGLKPGEYFVKAVPPTSTTSRRRTILAPSFYPGVQNANAAVGIVVASGSKQPDADIVLQSGRLLEISGQLMAPDGTLVTDGSVALATDDELWRSVPITTKTDADGSFLFRVPVDDYIIEGAVRTDDGLHVVREELRGLQGDVLHIVLHVPSLASISGRVTVEPQGARLPSSVNLRVYSILRGPFEQFPAGRAVAQPDSTFAFKARPGQMRLQVGGLPTPWIVREIRRGESNLLDDVLEIRPGDRLDDVEIVVTNNSAAIAGTAVDHRGAKVQDYLAVLFSVDGTKWPIPSRFVKAVAAADDGSFLVDAMPPGDYYIAAVTDLNLNRVFSPNTLARLSRVATRVTLKGGQAHQAVVKVENSR